MPVIDAEKLLTDVHAVFTRHFGEQGALLLNNAEQSQVEVFAVDPFNGYEFFYTVFAGDIEIEVDAGYTNTATRQTYYVADSVTDPKSILNWLEGAMRRFHGDAPLIIEHLGATEYTVINPATDEHGNFSYTS